MRISPIITPFRWYDEYYNQDRFQTECDSVCEFNLICDKRRLLPFQFYRPASGYGIKKWILRKFCDEPCTEILREGDRNFVSGSMRWEQGDVESWEFGCNNIACAIPIVGTGELFINNVLTIGKKYTVKFTVATYVGNMTLYCWNGIIQIFNTNSSGIKEFTFTATATNFRFEFVNGNNGEQLCIEDVSICQEYEPLPDDIDLPTNLLSLEPITIGGVTKDIIGYCGDEFGFLIPENKYYSIIIDNEDKFYYSEVIYVKNFEYAKSPYVILEWLNTCDIQDVIYTPLTKYNSAPPTKCGYINRIYLEDGVLTRPDYPFKEEVEEDGNAIQHPTFQRWQKVISLLAHKVPEFIIDALTAIRLHNTILYTEPLRIGQYTNEGQQVVKSLEYEVQFVLNDCFGNVNLKMTLADQYVDETCCNNGLREECIECEYNILFINDANPVIGYALFISYLSYPDGFYLWDGIAWVLQTQKPVICDLGTGKKWTALFGGIYQPTPKIVTALFTSGSTFYFKANVIGFGQLEYSCDNGATWITHPNIISAPLWGGFGLLLTVSCLPCCGDILFRVHSFTLLCDYGRSDVVSVLSPDQSCC